MTKFCRILIPVLILSFLGSCEDKTPCNCDDQVENSTCNDEEQAVKVDETVADETNVDETVDKDASVVEPVD